MYAPALPPSSADGISGFLVDELQRISQAMNEAKAFYLLEMSYSIPAKPRDGMVVLADGTSWNPGSGAGYYGYRAGAWRFLG